MSDIDKGIGRTTVDRWSDDYYYPITTADGTSEVQIDPNSFNTGDHIPTTQEERERKLLERIDNALIKFYTIEKKYINLQAQLTDSQYQTENRNEAISEVVRLVAKTIKITGDIYDNIVKKINTVRGSYSAKSIAEAYTIKSIAEEVIKERSKEVMSIFSRSKRRLTLKPDKLQPKKSKTKVLTPKQRAFITP